MRLSHTCDVDGPVTAVFDALADLERAASCMPGALVTRRVDHDTFEGEVAVRLGPLALAYVGEASLVEVDRETHRLTLRARGKEQGGAGDADARVAAVLHDRDGATRIAVETDLGIRGQAARCAQGVIGEVADAIVDEFARNVEALLLAGARDVGASAPEGEPAGSSQDVTPGRAHEAIAAIAAVAASGPDGWRRRVPPVVQRVLPVVAATALAGLASYTVVRAALRRARHRRR